MCVCQTASASVTTWSSCILLPVQISLGISQVVLKPAKNISSWSVWPPCMISLAHTVPVLPDEGTVRLAFCSNFDVCCNTPGTEDNNTCCASGSGTFGLPDANVLGPLNASHLQQVVDVGAPINETRYSTLKCTSTTAATTRSVSSSVCIAAHNALIGEHVRIATWSKA